MTYYADLTEYVYLDSDVPMRNVGWLDRDHDFPCGRSDPATVEALVVAAQTTRHQTRGYHECELCWWRPADDRPYPFVMNVPGSDVRLTLGSAEIHATGADGTVYAAPDLVVHYVVTHDYLPPAAFVSAVLAGI